MHHAMSGSMDVSQTANLVDPGVIRCQPAEHIVECRRDVADRAVSFCRKPARFCTVMIASPPIRSTKSSSLSCLIRSMSVAITWNFRLELPALMTKTFILSRRTRHGYGVRDRSSTESRSAINQFVISLPRRRLRYAEFPWDRILSSACAALVMTMRRPHG